MSMSRGFGKGSWRSTFQIRSRPAAPLRPVVSLGRAGECFARLVFAATSCLRGCLLVAACRHRRLARAVNTKGIRRMVQSLPVRLHLSEAIRNRRNMQLRLTKAWCREAGSERCCFGGCPINEIRPRSRRGGRAIKAKAAARKALNDTGRQINAEVNPAERQAR